MTDKHFEQKGTFRRWSPESIDWYERASEYTQYHRHLTDFLLPHLRANDDCCELACGTGTLARALAPHTASYTANDIDAEAIAHNEAMLRQNAGKELSGLRILPGDWKTALAGMRFDTVIFSFFGAVLRDWDTLQQLAARRIIAITYGGEKKTADDAKSKQEHAEDIIAFLEEKNIPYETEFAELEFGQPLRDLKEAVRYTKYYYPFGEEQIRDFLKNKLEQHSDGTLFFPKKKPLGIVVIRMDETAK